MHIQSKTVSPMRLAAEDLLSASQRLEYQYHSSMSAIQYETLMRLHAAATRADSQELIAFIDDHSTRHPSHLISHLNRKDPYKGVAVLHVAVAAAKSLENVELLMSLGADPRLTTKEGFSPAHLALAMRNEPMLEVILRQGIRNTCDRHGFTHLHGAALFNDAALVRKYLHIGGELNARIIYGTPIAQQVKEHPRRPRCEKDMLSVWPVRARDYWHAMKELPVNHEYPFSEYTALHIAVEHGNVETAQAIVEQPRLEINAQEARGFSALHLACGYPDEKIATDLAQLLIVRGIDVNARTVSGATPLHVAAYAGYETLVILLLAFGAKPDVCEDWDGVTPLHLAARNLLADAVHVMLVFGADAQRKDNKKRTALHWMVAREWCYDISCCVEIKKNKKVSLKLYDKIIQWLLADECDINAQDLLGRTAMHMAIKFHNACGAQRLERWGPDLEIYDCNYKTVKEYDKWKTMWCTTCMSIHTALSANAENEQPEQ